jgi:hypothetical protein
VAFFTSEKAKEKASKRKADARIINAQQKRKKALK